MTCRKHPCGPYHRELVLGYRLARQAQEMRCEAATAGYASEVRDYYANTERSLTFKDWLIG